LNNLIEQDHRSIKLRLGSMLGLKRFRSASITIAGIVAETHLVRRIEDGSVEPSTPATGIYSGMPDKRDLKPGLVLAKR
jgi:transposase-like protein